MRRLAAALVLASAACTSATVDDTFTTSQPGTTSTASATLAPTGWVELAPMAVARSEHPAVAVGGELVVAGGLIEVGVGRTGVTPIVESYSPETDTWSELPDLPEARHHGMAAVTGDRLFFFGGHTAAGDPSAGVWELVEGAWVDRAALPAPTGAGAAVPVGDFIYLVGGVPDGLFYRYDPAANSWATLPAPARQREHVAAVALDDEIWAIAGRWAGEIFNTSEVFDPESQAWRAGPNLVEARSGFGAAAVDGAIVVAGGEVFSPDETLTSVERLDPVVGEWASIESLPHGLHGNPLVAIGTAVYLPGGSTRAAAVANEGAVFRLEIG